MITAILLIMCVMALITDLIGVHTVLGAFVAGLLVGESPILTRHIDEQLRGMITAFFAPVFFGIAGLTADLTILADPKIALFTVGLISSQASENSPAHLSAQNLVASPNASASRLHAE